MNQENDSSSRLESTLMKLKQSAVQLRPVLIQFQVGLSHKRELQFNYTKAFVQPCQDVIKALGKCVKPLEYVYGQSKLPISSKEIPLDDSFFDTYFSKLVFSALKALTSQTLPSDTQISLLAAFLPLLEFFLVCISSPSADPEQCVQFNSAFATFHALLPLQINGIVTSGVVDIIPSLKSLVGIVANKEDCENAKNSLGLLLEQIASIKTKTSKQSLYSLKSSLDSFRAEIIKFLPQLMNENEFKRIFSEAQKEMKQLDIIIDNVMVLLQIHVYSKKVQKFVAQAPVDINTRSIKCDAINDSCNEIYKLMIKTLMQQSEYSAHQEDLSALETKFNSDNNTASIIERITEVVAIKLHEKENNDPLSLFQQSVEENKNDIRERSIDLIASQLKDVLRHMKLQSKPSAFMEKIGSVFNTIKKAREITSYSAPFDLFLMNYECLTQVCWAVANEDIQESISAVIKDEIPSPASVAELIQIHKIVDSLEDVVNSVNEIPVVTISTSDKLFTTTTKFAPQEMSNGITKLERPTEIIFNLRTSFLRAAYLLEFYEAHLNLYNYLDSHSTASAVKEPQLDTLRISTSFLSLLVSNSQIKVTPEFMQSWAHIVLASLTGQTKQDDFVNFSNLVPYIDFSSMLQEAANNSNLITSLIRRIENEKSNDLSYAAEAMRTIFYNGLIGMRISLDAFNQSSQSMLHSIAQNFYEYYPSVYHLWVPIHSMVSHIFIMNAFTERLNFASNSHLSVIPSLLKNLHRAISQIIKTLVQSNYYDGARFEQFEVPDLSSDFLYPKNEIEIRVSILHSMQIFDSNEYFQNTKLFKLANDFLQGLTDFAASPSPKTPEVLIEVLQRYNNVLMISSQGIQNNSFENISYFVIEFNRIPFNLVSFPNELLELYLSLKEVIFSTSQAFLYDFLCSLMKFLLHSQTGERESFLVSQSKPIPLSLNDITEIPRNCRLLFDFDSQLNQICQSVSFKEKAELLYLSKSLVRIVQESLNRFREQSEEVEQLKKEEGEINSESMNLIEQLKDAVNAHNQIIGDGVLLPQIDQLQESRYDQLQMLLALQSIETEQLKTDISELKQSISAKDQSISQSSEEKVPQAEAIQKILKEIIRPKSRTPNDKDELYRRLEEISQENENLLDELSMKQRQMDSHESQLDMLIIKSDELRSIQSRTTGKEELEALRRQISDANQTVSSLKKKLQKEETKDVDTVAYLRSFLRSTRVAQYHEMKQSPSLQKQFIDETIAAAEQKIKIRAELIKKRDDLRNQMKEHPVSPVLDTADENDAKQ